MWIGEEKFEKLKDVIQDKISQPVEKWLKGKQAELERWAIRKVELLIVKILNKARPKIKAALTDDEYMWGSVKHLVEEIVDEIWPEVTQEIILYYRIKTMKPYNELPLSRIQRSCDWLCCWRWLRNWYLYTMMPCKLPS